MKTFFGGHTKEKGLNDLCGRNFLDSLKPVNYTKMRMPIEYARKFSFFNMWLLQPTTEVAMYNY